MIYVDCSVVSQLIWTVCSPAQHWSGGIGVVVKLETKDDDNQRSPRQSSNRRWKRHRQLFTHVGAYQCSVLIVRWLTGCLYVSATAIVVLAEAAQRRWQSTRLIHCLRGAVDSNKATTDPSMHARLSSLDIYANQPATPTLEKQLPLALSSFVGGLGR